MTGKDYSICMLLDFYSALLSDSQRTCLELYYNEDLSLSEISENVGMSRQGALGNIKKGERSLRDYEEKLGLVKRFSEEKAVVRQIDGMLCKLGDAHPELSCEIERINKKIGQLLK